MGQIIDQSAVIVDPFSVVRGVPVTVLVVDDETTVLDLCRTVLPDTGFAVRTAATGEDALRIVSQERFACVIMDKNLPGIDGLEVMRTLRQVQPYCACILLTGYASKDSAVEAMRLGAADYIEKPFDVHLLVERVQQAVAHKRATLESQLLRERIVGMQSELANHRERLARLSVEAELRGAGAAVPDEASERQRLQEALIQTCGLARDLLDRLRQLSAIIRAQQQGDPTTASALEAASDVAKQLDVHLELVEFIHTTSA